MADDAPADAAADDAMAATVLTKLHGTGGDHLAPLRQVSDACQEAEGQAEEGGEEADAGLRSETEVKVCVRGVFTNELALL